jgi:hypothetical protein
MIEISLKNVVAIVHIVKSMKCNKATTIVNMLLNGLSDKDYNKVMRNINK